LRPDDDPVQRDPTFQPAACTSLDDDDRALVERFRDGDRQAFTELVVRHQRSIYNAAFWITKRPEDARDAAQTTFLKAAERIDDYDPQYKFFSWIYRIAVNEALNQVRRSGHEDALDDETVVAAPDGADPANQFAERQRAKRLHEAMMKLSTNDRTVLTLRHFGEQSYADIAQALGIEERTVKSRLFDARNRLRQLLGDL
jgi:RNA polymerase sigma-70 factor (ECF subfamily)